jgi:hypothetical protein
MHETTLLPRHGGNSRLPGLLRMALCAALLLPATLPAASVLVDFGHLDQLSPGPDDQGRHWNNLATDSGQPPAGGIADLLSEQALSTGLSLSVAGFGAGANLAGSTVPDEVALGPLARVSATRDGFFIAAGDTAWLALEGLDPAAGYRLEIFASRDAEPVRRTRITVAADPLHRTELLQTSGSGIGLPPQPGANRAATALFASLRANAAGRLDLAFTVEEGQFGYLGALRLDDLGPAEGNLPPTALDPAWEGAPAAGSSLVARYSYQDPEGDAEAATQFQWQRRMEPGGAALDIAGATGPIHVPGDGDLGAEIRVVVTPAAASGASPGAPAHSAWRGPVADAQARRVFHVGNSFTRWADLPRQVADFAAAQGLAHVRGDQLSDGQGLAHHWANGLPGGAITRGTPLRLELASGGWEVLILQPQSRQWLPENLAAFAAEATPFDSLCEATGTELFLFQYWPYLSEAPGTQMEINAAFEQVRGQLSATGPPVRVIPAGEALAEALREIDAGALPGLSRADFYLDDLHQSDIGGYLTALVHHAVIHARSPLGLPAMTLDADEAGDDPVMLPSWLAARLQHIAWDTARSHPGSGVPRARYEAWAELRLPPGQRAPLDDPFGEDLSNLRRWAFGLLPEDSLQGGQPPRAWVEGNRLHIEYALAADAADAGLRHRRQWSWNLSDWTPAEPESLAVTLDGTRVHLETPLPAEGWLFFRCLLELPR